MLVKVAWRNIWRSKKRSMIIMLAVSIGLSGGMFLIAFYSGMIEGRIQSAVKKEYSHLQIHHPAFREDYDIQYVIPNGNNLLNTILEDPQVDYAAGRVIIQGMINSPYGSRGVTVNGVIADKEQGLTGLADKLVEGTYFDTTKHNQLIISERMMKKLKLKLNNKAVLTFQDKDGNIATAAFRVCGVYRTINAPYDDMQVFTLISSVDALAGIPDQFNEIAVLYKDNKFVEPAVAGLSAKYPDLEILKWTELSPELGITVSAVNQMVYIFMGIIMLALAFGIVNTMMMSVLERTHELGMLMALGMNRLRIFLMIVLETFFLILAGCPVGIFVAGVAVGVTHRTGVTLKGLEELYASFGYSDVVYPSLSLDQLYVILIMIIITAVCSSLFPAWRALRLNPAQAIRK